jgi:hypothetical protein
MMSNMGMKDLRDQRERDLGPVAGPIYNALHDQVTDLQAKWEQYRVLYVESDEHVADTANTLARVLPTCLDCSSPSGDFDPATRTLIC